jgi:hypothetical protein
LMREGILRDKEEGFTGEKFRTARLRIGFQCKAADP